MFNATQGVVTTATAGGHLQQRRHLYCGASTRGREQCQRGDHGAGADAATDRRQKADEDDQADGSPGYSMFAGASERVRVPAASTGARRRG